MSRGRPPKPAALRALQGGAGHRKPDGRRELSLPTGTPDPPRNLSPGAKQEWFRIVGYLQPVAGLLSPIDATALGVYCSYYDQWQQAELDLPRHRLRLAEIEDQLGTRCTGKQRAALEKSCGRARNDLNTCLGERNKSRKEIRVYLADLGMNPAARARIRVPDGQLPLPGLSDPLAASRAALAGA